MFTVTILLLVAAVACAIMNKPSFGVICLAIIEALRILPK